MSSANDKKRNFPSLHITPSPTLTGSACKHISFSHFLTSGWLSEQTEGSRSSMARTAPGWMTTISDEEEEEAG